MKPADHPVAVPTAVAAVALSWLGLVIHNLAELPGQARLGPATIAPTAPAPTTAIRSAGPGAASHTALSAVSMFAARTARCGVTDSGKGKTASCGILKQV